MTVDVRPAINPSGRSRSAAELELGAGAGGSVLGSVLAVLEGAGGSVLAELAGGAVSPDLRGFDRARGGAGGGGYSITGAAAVPAELEAAGGSVLAVLEAVLGSVLAGAGAASRFTNLPPWPRG